MDFSADTSPRQLARIAGALYLINILGGAFAIGFVPAMLVVSGDPAATAHNIQAHELLYRVGGGADGGGRVSEWGPVGPSGGLQVSS